VLFVGIMAAYHLLLTGRRWEALVHVISANALLVFGMILPGFLALTWAYQRLARKLRPAVPTGQDQRDPSRSAASRAASAMRST
jgi:hypothetical protein